VNEIEIVPGQVWADADPRSAGRRIEITEVGDGWAKGRILSVERNVSAKMVGRTTRKIALRRFKLNNRGYRLVSNPATGTSSAS
jgi:hypothetical protein